MATKLKDFLLQKMQQGGITSTDLSAALSSSTLNEIEIPDEVATKFNEAFLTRERAKNDPEIVGEIKKAASRDLLNAMDQKIEPFYKLISPEKGAEIKKTYETFKRIELLDEAVSESFKTTTTKVSDNVQKAETEWSKKVKDQKDAHKKEVEDLQAKNKDDNLNFALKGKLLGYKFADAFSSLKETIVDNTISKLKGLKSANGIPYLLERDENGNVQIKQNIDGVLRDVYIKDNDKLTIDKLLAQEVEPFIVKSNGQSTSQEGNQTRQQPDIKDWSKMTLEERRWAEHAQTAAQ